LSELHDLAATEALARFRARELSPVELLEAVFRLGAALERERPWLDRAERRPGEIGAVPT